MKILRFLVAVTIVFSISSCKNDKKQVGTNTNVEEKQQPEGFGNIEEEFQGVYYRFPSPEEMLNVIDRDELAFNPDLLAPIQSADNFLSTKSQALNLGIYIGDMAYITLFQRHNEAIKYLQIIYKLSDKLRISAAFDPSLMMRVENNLNNVDTLRAIAEEAFTDISDYLVRYEKEKTFAVISVGGFVESLYISLNLVKDYSADNIILQRISDQKLVLENLIKYTKPYDDDISVKESLELLKPIRDVFAGLKAESSSTKVKKDADGKIVLSGGNRIVITKSQFEDLKKQTEKVRKLIVES
jgi:hypothetical protein